MVKFLGYSQLANSEAEEVEEFVRKERMICNNMADNSKRLEAERFEYFETQRENAKQKEGKNRDKRKEEFVGIQLQYRKLNLAKKIKKRGKHSEMCSFVLDQILEMTEICFNKQRETEDIRVEQKVWDELMHRFVQGKALADEKVFRIFDKTEDIS